MFLKFQSCDIYPSIVLSWKYRYEKKQNSTIHPRLSSPAKSQIQLMK